MSSGAIFTATPTALIIDDDPVARRRLESILTALGVAVTVCSSVAEGLKALQADIGENGCVTFTRIFCDIVMPEAPGDALLSLLTSSGWPCSIVMVTGCASEEQRIKCESMGATAVLSKPVRRTVLRPYFEADELRDGRRLPGRPQVTLSVASQASRVANALLSCPADINPSTRLHAPSWAGFDGVPAGRRRAASAPRQRIPGWRSIVPHASGGGGGAPGLGNAGARGGTGSPDVDSSHTSVAVHSLAMGAALALAVHVETTERDVVKETMTPELEAAAALFEEQVAAGEMAPRATPERIYRFLMVLIINNTLDMPVAIEAIIFLERATRRSGLRLSHTNWKSLLLTSIIVASKAHCARALRPPSAARLRAFSARLRWCAVAWLARRLSSPSPPPLGVPRPRARRRRASLGGGFRERTQDVPSLSRRAAPAGDGAAAAHRLCHGGAAVDVHALLDGAVRPAPLRVPVLQRALQGTPRRDAR